MTPSSPTRRSSDLFTIRATLVNDDGRFTAGPLTVAVAASPPPPSLLVTQAAIDDGVLAVRFPAALGEAAPGDTVTLTGERFGLVAATIAYDADGPGFVPPHTAAKPLQYDPHRPPTVGPGFVTARG